MRDVIQWVTISTLFIILVAGQTLTIREHCDRFLKCELRMMEIHRKCTNNSRNEVAHVCDLVQDFSELSKLMLARVNEFANCVEVRAQDASLEFVEETACQSNFPIERAPKTCWESVAQAKQRCQQLQSCCPAVKKCLKSGKNSPLTRALREKHSIINGRTSECRNDMRLVLRRPHRQDDPMAAKARAVLIAQGEKIVENIIQDEQLEKFGRPHDTMRLETTRIRMPLQDDMQVKMQTLVKQLSKIILSENPKMEIDDEVTTMTSQIEETTTESPTTITPTPSTTTEKHMLMPKIVIKKHKKIDKHSKEPILSSDPIRNLVTQRPHFSFALPSTVNLTNVFAARPALLYNSTTSPLAYRKTTIGREPIDNADVPAIRRPLPPIAPPMFKIDSGVQDEVASRTMIDRKAPHFDSARESFVDAETDNEIDWTPRKSRVYAASSVNASAIQLHLIDHLRHKQQKDIETTTTSVQIEFITTRPKENEVEDEARLIKLLRQMRLKPEDTQMRIRVKNPRLFDKEHPASSTESPSTEKKVHIFTNTKPSIPEKVMMIDASTELNQEPVESAKQSTATTKPLHITQLKQKPDNISKQKITVPIDADANIPLSGYRHKLLSIRRRGDFDKSAELVPTAKSRGHVRDDESKQTSNGAVNDQLERTTVAYAPNRILSVNLADVLVPINWKDIRRAPQRNLEAPFIEQIEETPELLQVRMDLIRNLEEFLEKHDFETKHQRREEIQLEEKRLGFLRRDRAEFERLGKKTNYCELYNVCTNQLRFVQIKCQNQTNQETSTFFKTKFGSCNARLWKQYQETDQIRMELLDVFGDCIIEEILTEQAETVSTCSQDWPVLPLFDDQTECAEKTRLIHDHCSALGKCCSSLKTCKDVAAKHELFLKLSDSKRMLNKNAQKCKTTTNLRSFSRTESPIQTSRTETIVPQQTSIRLI